MYLFDKTLAISLLANQHRPRSEEQDDLLRPRLVVMIDVRHELVNLAALIDWEVFEQEWAGFFRSQKGRPATETRIVRFLPKSSDPPCLRSLCSHRRHSRRKNACPAGNIRRSSWRPARQLGNVARKRSLHDVQGRLIQQ
jgi:hypothetical protein